MLLFSETSISLLILQISLLVFDECHHTRKNHAYNGIMREYFQIAIDGRPKVFGMTASPIWNPKNAAESLATLERNLDAKVIAVKEHVDELAGHSPRPEEVSVYALSSRCGTNDTPSTSKYTQWRPCNIPNTRGDLFVFD